MVYKWPFREVIENELVDYARIDLCIVGGERGIKKCSLG